MKTIRTMLVSVAAVLAVSVAVFAADEITASYGLSVEKGYLSFSRAVQGQKIDMTGDAVDFKVTNVGTNPTTVTVTDSVGTPGMAFWRNGSTNLTVNIGVDATLPLVRLYPGECWQGRLATNTVSMVAATNWYGATNLTGTATAPVESAIIEE